MKKVKKMALGGMGANMQPQIKNAGQAFASAGMKAPILPKMSGPLGGMGKPPATPPAGVNVAGIPNKPPAGYADDLAGIYAAAKNKPQIFGPQARMPSGGPKPVASTMAAPTTAAKPVPLNPNYMKKGGKVSSASKRGDGIAQRGKTKGRMI